MRIETKKVTIEQKVYIAKDGKEFFSEDSCEQYETKLIEQSLQMWDHKFEKTDELDACYYIRFATKEDIRDFIVACKWYGIAIDGIKDVGLYTYVEGRKDNWLNLTEVMEKLGGIEE